MVLRKSSFILAACLFWSLASACHRSGEPPQSEQRAAAESSSTAPPTPPQAPPDNRPVIVTFGDSLTAGVAGPSYPDDLQDLLDQNGYKYRVENQGVSGDTTTDGLARIDNVLAAHPALVLLEFGGNDGLRGIPVESTEKNLEEMIVRLKQANIPLVLLGITLPPNYGPDYVRPFTAMFPALAKKYHLRSLPFLLIDVYQHPDMMQPDGIHPNGKGNEVVARDVFHLIQPLL
ncbi:MAG: arylesterase [Acidobacteriaceae bacterium]|nr:arylesterase [Acidobacteriaceae bacterium]MBV9498039.1 arylesterase [Acidobacteriaceae bacterium]